MIDFVVGKSCVSDGMAFLLYIVREIKIIKMYKIWLTVLKMFAMVLKIRTIRSTHLTTKD